MAYRFVKISGYYRNFVKDFYSKNTEIASKSYDEQLSALLKARFAFSDSFSNHLQAKGVEAHEIIHNAEPLQQAWAKENGVADNQDVLFEQIKKYRPEVLFIHATKDFSINYLQHLRKSFPFIKLFVGYICAPFADQEILNYQHYDLILTCLPMFQKQLEKHGVHTSLFYHGFEPIIVDEVKENNAFENNDFIFIGSFIGSSTYHDYRLQFIERLLAEGIDLRLYANIQLDNWWTITSKQIAYVLSRILYKTGLNTINEQIAPLKKVSVLNNLPKQPKYASIFAQKIQSPVYGLDMFKLLSRSKIGFNIHGGISGEYAANIRMFETTGVGSLLMTDHKKNIRDFFEPDTEIVTYQSEEECIEKTNWLLDHPKEAAAIALAGQKRTLKDHAIGNRIAQFHETILEMLKGV